VSGADSEMPFPQQVGRNSAQSAHQCKYFFFLKETRKIVRAFILFQMDQINLVAQRLNKKELMFYKECK